MDSEPDLGELNLVMGATLAAVRVSVAYMKTSLPEI